MRSQYFCKKVQNFLAAGLNIVSHFSSEPSFNWSINPIFPGLLSEFGGTDSYHRGSGKATGRR